MRVHGAGQVVAVKPCIERGHLLAGGDNGANEACGDVLLADPGMQVGIVDDGGGYDLCMRVSHDTRHVAAHALELLGLAAGCHAGRRGAHGLACLRDRGALAGTTGPRRCSGCRRRGGGTGPGTAVSSSLFHILQRDHATFAGGTHAAQVDLELACHRTHCRHGLDAAGTRYSAR